MAAQRTGTANHTETLTGQMLSRLEALAAAAAVSDAEADAFCTQLSQLMAAAPAERALPLSNPSALFTRIAALLGVARPRECAVGACSVLANVLHASSARVAQAAAFADALLPGLIRVCRRGGESLSPSAIRSIIYGNATAAGRARQLGAVEAMARYAAELTPGVGAVAGDGAADALGVLSDICKLTAATADELRAFAAEPGVLSQAARWLKHAGSPAAARAGAAELADALIGRREAAAAAQVVLGHEGILSGIADAVADAAAFRPSDLDTLGRAVFIASHWASDAQLAAMANTPGFFTGVALMLSTRHTPPSFEFVDSVPPASEAGKLFCNASLHLATLLQTLAARPTRRLFEARLRLVAALDARAALASDWATAAQGAIDAEAPGGRWLAHIVSIIRHMIMAKGALLQISRPVVVAPTGRAAAAAAAAAPAAGEAGRGDCSSGGSSSSAPGTSSEGGAAGVAPPAAPSAAGASARPAAAAAAAAATPGQRCFTCGREERCGAPLLQCASCKGTGLKAFFCDKACLKAGWKAHKPACEAARRRQRDSSGSSGGGDSAAV